MLTSIHIQNFKSFKDTKIEPLRKVNLILGGQNVGKTSLLEAVWLGVAPKSNITKLPSIFRGIDIENDKKYFFDSIFNNSNNFIKINDLFLTYNKKGAIESAIEYLTEAYSRLKNINPDKNYNGCVDKDIEDGFLKIYNCEFCRQPDFNSFEELLAISINLPQDHKAVDLFGKVFEKRKKKSLIQLLQKIEPRLEDINTSNINNEWRIYVDVDGNSSAVPISYMGHGFNRLFHLYCSLLETDAKLTLIDEIENGIYYAALPTLFKGIQQIATNNDIQSLITTHSWECIQAAYNVFAEAGRLEDFQLIRLEQDGDNVRAVLINDEDLDTIMEAGHEIR